MRYTAASESPLPSASPPLISTRQTRPACAWQACHRRAAVAMRPCANRLGSTPDGVRTVPAPSSTITFRPRQPSNDAGRPACKPDSIRAVSGPQPTASNNNTANPASAPAQRRRRRHASSAASRPSRQVKASVIAGIPAASRCVHGSGMANGTWAIPGLIPMIGYLPSLGTCRMRLPLLLATAVLLTSAACVHAADKPAQGDAKPDAPADVAALPADASVRQSIRVDGRTLDYTATVGTLPVRDEQGKTVADVTYVAYTAPGANRPVTFALNGGPGASSVYLNFGAIGPKVVAFGKEGDSPSDPATLHDNPGTWLDFTDMVFIDPVGTGFSRSRLPPEETKKRFYTPTADIEYLSRTVYDWLVKNHRLQSRKYLVGESYGTAARASPTTCRPGSASR